MYLNFEQNMRPFADFLQCEGRGQTKIKGGLLGDIYDCFANSALIYALSTELPIRNRSSS